MEYAIGYRTLKNPIKSRDFLDGWGLFVGFFWARGGNVVIAVTAIGKCGGAAMVAGVDALVGYGEGRGLRRW